MVIPKRHLLKKVSFWLGWFWLVWPHFTEASSGVTLQIAGDVMLARSVTATMRQGNDFNYPFSQVKDVLSSADITWVNLESPFGQDCPTVNGGMVFCADYRSVEGLVESGVDLISLANNHALDQGTGGLETTRRLLVQNFLRPTGLREPVVIEEKGLKIGFLNYNMVVPRSEMVSWAEPEVIVAEVKQLKNKVDLVIVFFHWGEEYTPKPQKGGGSLFSPRQVAYQTIEAGADLVVGAHPHVIQPPEWYRGKLIVYSLGNFIFDQTWSRETQRGIIGRFTLDREGLAVATYLPVEINKYQPRVVGGLDNSWTGF